MRNLPDWKTARPRSQSKAVAVVYVLEGGIHSSLLILNFGGFGRSWLPYPGRFTPLQVR